MSALEEYLPLVQVAAFFAGWIGAMVTGLFFAKAS